MNITDKIRRFLHREKHRTLLTAVGIAIVVGVYLFGTTNKAGFTSYAVAFPAMLGILITALARVNDIGPKLTALKWQARRIALTMLGASMVAYMYAPFSAYPSYPTWLASVVFWGLFLVWITAPDMQGGWWKYVSGRVRFTKSGKVISVK